MSDPRFARFKTDPRFRRIKKDTAKVTVDERFKGLFDGSKQGKKGKGRVDKYGRPLADTYEEDNLRRFYRLEEDEEKREPEAGRGLDYARGAVLLESSDEEDKQEPDDDESDTGGTVTLGRDVSKPILVPDEDEEAEIDLDEDAYAELNAQVTAYAKENPENDKVVPEAGRTRRLAVVNLDWDHVRAIHLYKIFSSLVSPTAHPAASTSTSTTNRKSPKTRGSASGVVRGKVLSVRVYPSEFGKERMAREEQEGPPPEVFKKKKDEEDEEINERTIFETGEEEDYDEHALRNYQLERLRYYYAVVECDSVEAASHIYDELEGTELERSANVFDLSFVPDNMSFDEEYRDEANDDLSMPYKGLDFVTDALRHSKVKLTWDDDEPDRVQLTRRTLSRKEIEENDFKAYLASSTSGSEDGDDVAPAKKKEAKATSRDKLRALLLGGGDDALPEGWGRGNGADDDASDVDMEITFMPGLSAQKEDHDETTLEKYQRKMRDKRKKRKEEIHERANAKEEKLGTQDDFFAEGSEEEGDGEVDGSAHEEEQTWRGKKNKRNNKGRKGEDEDAESEARRPATAEELALLVASDSAAGEPKHFNMKTVLKAEKKQKLKGKNKKKSKHAAEEENELQEGFSIDVKDERFKAVHEEYAFAIDPSNPRFKKTKSMSALLEERSKRQKEKPTKAATPVTSNAEAEASDGLKSLIERVKRKSAAAEQQGIGKRRRV
ncbi:uncharacterized protein LAESUDRAFT_815077 [Laetiporus sulphureus 93-53]|uniref:Uncharacterized protein n=1 Tax=Laetiporus sulphureus 93-53 TaxID=1314785 RepID=A0A165CDX0_9APHY|nr:uncharacterized protein LAESUDRAFT_815077 [Laetiporus sulphureus 93-53]KZT02636.1 hypothetical protein LAESUDRAFT_815077 [Laetiporus sulphureus 93-53]